jgi:anaerobic magnesium-protoporphyrin IX monomethyl ester cyclase
MSIERKPLTKKSSIVLISKAPSPDGKLDSPEKPGVFNAKLPTLGIPPVAAALDKAGFKNLHCIDTEFNPKGLVTKGNWKTIEEASLMMTTNISVNEPPTEELIRRARIKNPDLIVIRGGFPVTARDEEAVRNGTADIVVRLEGYVTAVETVEALINNGNVNGVKGTTHKAGGDIVREEDRPLLTVEELTKQPKHIYDPNVLKFRNYDTYMTSIGCPYNCNFCNVTDFYRGTYRRLPNEVIKNDLRDILKREPGKPVFLIDDNLFVDKKETKTLLKEMIAENLILPEGSMAQVRESAGADPEFLYLLRKAGVSILNVGIESINDDSLIEMNKGTTSTNIMRNIKNMREAGFWLHGMFIVGFDADTKDTTRELLDWAKLNVHSAQFFPPIPLPGTLDTLNKELEGRILSKKYNLYDGTYVLLRPKNFTPWELQQTILDMYHEFYSFTRLGSLRSDALVKVDQKHSANEIFNKDEVKKMLSRDQRLRIYANYVLTRMSMDSTRREYYKGLKNWKPGQTI